jgi:SynChlorMet cassette radical SAM/SPASM protein ScmE
MKIMRTPKSLELAITNKCNLRCTYCSHFSSAGDVGHDLPKEEWLEFFEELNRCAVMNITLEGGEPFLRRDLPEIIEGIIRNRMRFSILSNGTLLTDELAAFIASTGRCDYVQVSIDGSTSVTHDASRGTGSFPYAIKGIKICQRHQIPVTVRVTINKYNVVDLEKIAKLLLEDLELPSFSTNSALFMGLCRQNTDNIQLTIDERSLAMKTLLTLSKKYNGRIDAISGPLADADAWIKMEKARRGHKKSLAGRGYLTACKGVDTKIAVRADGIIVPCILMSHIELGRINQDDLKGIWQNHPELIRLRERRNIPLTDFEYCKGCEYIPYCTGNCPALAYTILGKENHPSPDTCLMRFFEGGGKLPDTVKSEM